ncbi:MAG TPA: hypothetical protein VII55_02455 [Candidatus Saccharimonadales bacterium]
MTTENIFDAKLLPKLPRIGQEEPVVQTVGYTAEQIDRLFGGAGPGVVWGEDEARLCSDFIDFAEARDFKGATKIEDYTPTNEEIWDEVEKNVFIKRPCTGNDLISEIDKTLNESGVGKEGDPLNWSIRGYGVAAYIWGDMPKTNLPFNVFICEDKKLRVWVSDKYNPGPASVPSSSFEAIVAMPDQGLEEDAKPNSIEQLPAGARYTGLLAPAIGHFVLSSKAARYETITGSFQSDSEGGGYWEANTRREVFPAHNLVDFEALGLEFLLTTYARAAEFGREALDAYDAAALGRHAVDPGHYRYLLNSS